MRGSNVHLWGSDCKKNNFEFYECEGYHIKQNEETDLLQDANEIPLRLRLFFKNIYFQFKIIS